MKRKKNLSIAVIVLLSISTVAIYRHWQKEPPPRLIDTTSHNLTGQSSDTMASSGSNSEMSSKRTESSLSKFLKSAAAIQKNKRALRDEDETALMVEKRKAISEIYWEKASEVLETMLKEQAEDYKWSYDVKVEAERLLRDREYEGTELIDTKCGATLCRMILKHKDLSARDRLVNGDFSQIGSWDGDQYGVTSNAEDGSPLSTMYFTRRGDYRPFIELSERIGIIAGYRPSESYSHLMLQRVP